MKDNVTSVSITGSVTVSVKAWASTFPQIENEEKSDYPFMVINPPALSWEKLTLTRNWVNGTITIDIYTTQGESADKFLDAIVDSIETYRDDLKGVGVSFITLDSTNSDNAFRGAFTVHMRSATFKFKYSFIRTFP